jgi:lipopolysaccharide export system protein LptA
MDHVSNLSTFYGTASRPARMWQDTDSLLAPVIAIDRSKGLLKAWGEETGTEPEVEVNFAGGSSRSKRPAEPSEVHSRTLVYSDGERLADFQGDVRAAQGDAAIHAEEARVYLKPKASAEEPEAKSSAGKRGSQLDRLVATGHVVFTEPGRRGNGEKLVYTADDEKYVLTGTPAAPPRLWDRNQGTTTGDALIFSSQTDKVQVMGGKSSVVTETHVTR